MPDPRDPDEVLEPDPATDEPAEEESDEDEAEDAEEGDGAA